MLTSSCTHGNFLSILLFVVLMIKLYGIISIDAEIQIQQRVYASNYNNNSGNFSHPHVDNQNRNLAQNTSFLFGDKASQPPIERWHFHIETLITLFLALFSFGANAGLLFLDRRAKPYGTMNNSSFSNNFMTNTNNNSNNNNNISTNNLSNSNNNNNPSFPCSAVGFTSKKWHNNNNNKRNSSRGLNLFIYHQATNAPTPQETLRSYSLSSPINKYPSSISLIKLNHSTGIFHHGSTQYHTPRSRRQRRYLRGLLGLSISNLSLSLSLISWCSCQLILHNISNTRNTAKAWLTIIAFINLWTIDIAQSLETGAILWIALERTLGIHWPSETHGMNNTNTSTNNNTNSTTTQSLPRFSEKYTRNDVKWRRTQLTVRMKVSLTRSLKKMKDNLNQAVLNLFCLNRCLSSNYFSCCTSLMTNSSALIAKKRNKKRFSCFIHIFLCFLPLVLFLIASVYSLSNIIYHTKKRRLHNHAFIALSPSNSAPDQYSNHNNPINFISDIQTTYNGSSVSSIYQNDQNTTTTTTYNNNNNNLTQHFNPLVIYDYFYTYYYNSVLWKQLPYYSMHIKHQIHAYYTSSIISALVIGQFLAPLAILVTTNLLIYQKVASRDKHFFSRQSSNTSKSSFISGVSVSSMNSANSTRKLTTATINFPIPMLRVLESSNQDIHTDVVEENPSTGEYYTSPSKSPEESSQQQQQQQPNKQHSLLVPLLDIREKSYPFPASNTPEMMIMRKNESLFCANDDRKYLLNERRKSTSVIQPAISYTELYDNPCEKSISPKSSAVEAAAAGETTASSAYRYSESSIKLSTLYALQKRRKSTNDLFSSLFQSSRGQEQNNRTAGGGGGGEEPILLQMLRRQHRRTLRILIILLLVFVLCRAPRSIVLMIEWLRHTCLEKHETHLSVWLQYTSIFAYSSAILDTIVYGFWGNRAYRIRMKNLYARRAFCSCVGCE
ncbi:unnamed protein product [Trichobilharzia szidati]|nr:unnamed protein product [Trichobilharzia szidati]